MRVFVTGATGFIGSAIVQELVGAGHRVLGLARSEEAAARLTAAGAEVHRGGLEDGESLKRGAAASDGVIHTAFIHDFSNMAASGETDRLAVEVIGAALAGSGRPFVVTGVTALRARGHIALEDDVPEPNPALASHRRASDHMALSLVSRNVRVSLVRLPPSVHGDGDYGFVPALIRMAREKGVSGYIGDGSNRWPAVHRLDAARVYRLALEKAPAGATFHAVADEGVPTRDIAEIIGRRLSLPLVSKTAEEAANHFGWLARFFGHDNPTSSALTRERLAWSPRQPSLMADLEQGRYFE